MIDQRPIKNGERWPKLVPIGEKKLHDKKTNAGFRARLAAMFRPLTTSHDQRTAIVTAGMVHARLRDAHYALVNLVGNPAVSENDRLRLEAIDEKVAELAGDVDDLKNLFLTRSIADAKSLARK